MLSLPDPTFPPPSAASTSSNLTPAQPPTPTHMPIATLPPTSALPSSRKKDTKKRQYKKRPSKMKDSSEQSANSSVIGQSTLPQFYSLPQAASPQNFSPTLPLPEHCATPIPPTASLSPTPARGTIIQKQNMLQQQKIFLQQISLQPPIPPQQLQHQQQLLQQHIKQQQLIMQQQHNQPVSLPPSQFIQTPLRTATPTERSTSRNSQEFFLQHNQLELTKKLLQHRVPSPTTSPVPSHLTPKEQVHALQIYFQNIRHPLDKYLLSFSFRFHREVEYSLLQAVYSIQLQQLNQSLLQEELVTRINNFTSNSNKYCNRNCYNNSNNINNISNMPCKRVLLLLLLFTLLLPPYLHLLSPVAPNKKVHNSKHLRLQFRHKWYCELTAIVL